MWPFWTAQVICVSDSGMCSSFGKMKDPCTMKNESPWRMHRGSATPRALLVKERKWIASSRLVFPIPFSPTMQLIFEMNSNWASS